MTKKKKTVADEVVENPNNLPSALFDDAKIDIKSLIRVIRGQQVMLDRDLARLYQTDTGQLNRQVKRNLDRFPLDFMFQLTGEELEILKCQNGISSWGGDRYLPFAFTRNGIAMLSSVLRSKTAIEVNKRIMRAFTAIPDLVNNNILMMQRILNIEQHQTETDEKVNRILVTNEPNGTVPFGLRTAVLHQECCNSQDHRWWGKARAFVSASQTPWLRA